MAKTNHRRRGTRPGLTREQSRELTRSKLLNAARAEFARHGLQGANLTDILKRAEVSPGAFYHHFSDKLDLFLAVVDEMSDRFREMLRESRKLLENPDGNLIEWISGCFRFMSEITNENRELFIIYVREIHSGNPRINDFFDRDQMSMRDEMESIIEEMISRNLLPDIDADWAAYLVDMLAQGAMLHRLTEQDHDDSWTQALAQFTLGGIRAIGKLSTRPPKQSSRQPDTKQSA